MSMQDTLHALADPTRREILNLLKQSRLSAGEISNHFSISSAIVYIRYNTASNIYRSVFMESVARFSFSMCGRNKH